MTFGSVAALSEYVRGSCFGGLTISAHDLIVTRIVELSLQVKLFNNLAHKVLLLEPAHNHKRLQLLRLCKAHSYCVLHLPVDKYLSKDVGQLADDLVRLEYGQEGPNLLL